MAERRQTVGAWANAHGLKPGAWVILWEDPPFVGARSPDGKWGAAGTLRLGDRVFLRDLEVWSWDGSELPLGTLTLRNLPLARWLSEVHQDIAARAFRAEREGRGSAEVRELVDSEMAPRFGPKGFGTDFYRRLALAYLELQSEGTKGIHQRLLKESKKRTGRALKDPEQVRDALSKATELKFLAPGQRGRAGRLPGRALISGSGAPALTPTSPKSRKQEKGRKR